MIKDKKIIKIIHCITIMLIFLHILSSTVLGTSAVNMVNPSTETDPTLTNTIEILIGIFQVIAIGVAVIMLIVSAIKFMTSSPSDKADIKKNVGVYLVGAVMTFGAVGIVEIIKNFAIEALK